MSMLIYYSKKNWVMLKYNRTYIRLSLELSFNTCSMDSSVMLIIIRGAEFVEEIQRQSCKACIANKADSLLFDLY